MAEEGDRKNHPSLPSNYVTLVQLQERWLQEQQRKQREKEEKEEEKPKLRQREKEEGERKREDQENSDQKRQIETNTPSRLHPNRPPFRNSRWISSDKSSRVSERKSEESQFGGKSKIEDLRKKEEDTRKGKGEKKGKTRAEEDVIGCTEQLFPKNEDEDQKIPAVSTESDFQRNGKSLVANGMDLKKRNKWKHRRNWKPRAENDLTGGTEQLLPDNVDEGEKIPVISTERDSDFQRKDKSLVVDGMDLEKKNQRKKKRNRKPRPEKDLTGGTEHLLPENVVEAEKIQVVSTERDRDFHPNGKSLVVNGLVWEKKVPVDQSVEIGRSFQNLSVSSGKGGHQRHAWNTRGCQRNYHGGSGRFNDRRLERRRDSNSVWVRKGEGDTSDANVSRV